MPFAVSRIWWSNQSFYRIELFYIRRTSAHHSWCEYVSRTKLPMKLSNVVNLIRTRISSLTLPINYR